MGVAEGLGIVYYKSRQNMPENTFEIRFAGGGILPENIRAGEMAEILSSIEDMLSAIVAKDHPTLSKEDLVVGLVNIQSGSVHLEFSSKIPEVTFPAFVQVTKSIRSQNFGGLPATALKSLQSFSSFVRKKNCEAEFISRDGTAKTKTKIKVLATMTPDIQIETPGFLRGETTIYGQVIRVGGRDPRAMIETVEGATIYCEMVDEDLARELGERLYTMVSLKGKAKWDSQTLRLEDFKAHEVADYHKGSILKAFEELSSIAGKYFSDITDVKKYIDDLRDQDSEE